MQLFSTQSQCKTFTFFTTLFSSIALFLSTNTQAQGVASYNFSQLTGTYTALSTGSTTSFTSTDNSVTAAINIGFTFNYNATNYTNCLISTNGFLTLGNATTPSASVYNAISNTGNAYDRAIAAFSVDLVSTVKYQTTGTSPNRVFTVEWTGYRFSIGNTESLQIQLKLYETTNNVEVQYGNCTTPNTTFTTSVAEVGLKSASNVYNNVSFTNANLSGYTYTNNWNSLINGALQNDAVGLTTTIKPATGSILRWRPSVCNQVAIAATVSSITTSSAIVSWTNNAAYASGYKVRWRKVDETYSASTWASPVSVAAGLSTYTITGLTPSTYYVFSVEGQCSASSANNYSTVTTTNTNNGKGLFSTTCVNSTLPYAQGFNASTIATCWSQQFVTGTSAIQYVTTSANPTTTPAEGTHHVFWNSISYTSGNQTRLVSPAITTTGAANVNARFKWFHDNSAYLTAGYADEGVKLQYSLNGTAWFDVQSVNRLLTGTNGWTTYDIALPAAACNVSTVYVGFLFTSRFGNNCSLDDVLVYVPGPCTTPTNQPTALTFSNITNTSLNGSFTPASPAPSSYIVFRSTSNINPTPTNGTTYTVAGSPYTFSGNQYTVVATSGTGPITFTEASLVANTTYYYYAMSVNTACIGAPFYLTTLPLKNSVLTCTNQTASLTGTSITPTSATINFTPIVGAISYQLEYRINGAPTWTVASPAPTTSPYTLTGLSPGNIYDIRIEGPNANCGNRRTTNSAFTTPCSNLTLPVFQGFEAGTTIPSCWTQQFVSGTKSCSYGSSITAAGTSPNPVAFAGIHRLLFPSYSGSGNQTRIFTPPITTIGTANVDVNYQWYFSSIGGSTSYLTEGVQVIWSTNGTSWTNAGTLVRRYGATDGWQKQVITLPAGAGNQSTLYVGFLLTANAGYDAYIDDVEVKATPACSTSNGGTITAVATSICGSSGSTTITAVNYTASSTGLSYQWQSSTDNFVSNIVDIAGATNPASLNTGTITITTSYRLRVFCTVAGYSYSNIATVTINNPQINTTTAATRCGIGTVNLQATATSGSVIKWYAAASGGAPVGTGSPFTTPSISTSTTYYVGAANAGSTLAAVGPTSPTSHGGSTDNQTINWRVYFDVIQATTLQSVDVFPITAGQTATLYIFNSGGTQLIAVPYTTTVSGGTTAQTIPINLALTVGANYNLYASGIPTSGLKRNTSGAVYPYTSSSINITGNGYDNTYYMCYYNWRFVTGCESARTAVTATVTAPPAIALSASTATICSGSSTTVSVTAGTVGNFTSYSWSPTTAVVPGGVPSGSSVTLSPTATTTYVVSGSTVAGCVNQASIVVTVNPAPPVTVGAAVCSGTNATISATSSCTNFTNAGTAIPGNWNAATDPVAIQPVIFLPNSTTCEFDPTGNTMNYTTTTFQVSVTGTYTFAMDANTSYDGMGYIVTGPFVPGVCPGSGTWVVGDDDSGPSSLEPLMTANLTAGITYTLISTCYSSSSGTVTGAFNWGITPPSGGQITTVSNGNLQWYTSPVGGSPISTSSPFNPVGVVGSGIASNTSVGAYTFYAACSNNAGCRTATGYAIGAPGQWIGASNSTWANTANWCGTLPTTSTNVIIPNGAPNMPVLSTGIGTVNNLTVNTGAMLTISNATMQIAGAITASTGTINATTGTIQLVGTTTQTIAGSAFTGRNVQNVVASNNVNVSAIANDTLRITGALSFGNTNNKTINSNDNITLVSNAAGTARVADVTNNGVNTGNTINGKFVVERFIPARRAWRLLTTPIANGAQTINQAWQEGVGGTWSSNLKPGYGTHITGGSLRTTAQGFDQGPNNPSIYGYSGVNWNQLPATTAELTSARQGYMLFIRGSRSINLPASTPGTVPDNTVLRPTGSIKVGSQPAVTNPGGGFTVVGNPYPSAINFNNVTKSGVIGGLGGNNAYYLWDPNLGGSFGYGAFVVLSWNGTSYDKNISTSNVNTNGIISSGAAFMVNVNAGGSVTFDENDKVADGTGTSILFRPIRNRTSLSVTLATVNGDGSLFVNDGALLTCTRESSNEVNKEDAVKINNFAENICFQLDSINIAIERRQSISLKDTLLFNMWNMKQKKYALIISTDNFVLPKNALMFLEDTYLQTKTLVHTNFADTLLFDITSDVKSAAKNRFRLIFNNEKSQNLLTSKSAPTIVIAPNPVIGTEVNFLTNNIPNGTYSLSVITQDGKILTTNKWTQNNQLINGQLGQLLLQQKLPAGNYLLKVVGNNIQPMAIPFLVE